MLYVTGDTLANTWEKSIIELINNGARIKTEYDKKDDPPSIDAMMAIEICKPLSEPMITSFFPGGPEDLEEYSMEVCEGIKDHWIRNSNDPNDHRWSYTYHQRLFNHNGIDQIKEMVNRLARSGYTRRSQAITWMPSMDAYDDDPPCLQRIWCRIYVENNMHNLHAHVFWRSRDALKAAFMNMFALIRLINDHIVKPISDATGNNIHFSKYVDVSDSYHIYGSDIKNGCLDTFNNCISRGVHFNYNDWKEIMDSSRSSILDKVNRNS